MKTLHPNYIKASNMLFLSMIIGIVGFLIDTLFTGLAAVQVISLIFSLLVTSVLIYFIRNGHAWVKYFFLVTFILVLVLFGASLPFLGQAASEFSVPVLILKAIFGTLSWGLQLLTMVLLFQVPRPDIALSPSGTRTS